MPRKVDLVVIGAGAVGLAVADRVAAAGGSVHVLEAGSLGGRGSRAAAGVAVPSVRLLADPELLEFARAGAEELDRDLQRLPSGRSLRRGEGVLRLVKDQQQRDRFETDAQSHRGWLGSWVPGEDLPRLEPALERTPVAGAFSSGEGYVVDAGGYVDAVLQSALDNGVELSFGRPATSVDELELTTEIATPDGPVVCDRYVVTAGAWSGMIQGLPPLPVRPLRGQMVVLRMPGIGLTHVVSGAAYLAPWSDGDIVLGATEEDAGFNEEVSSEGLLYLLAFMARSAPALRPAAVIRSWAGLRAVTPDGRPYIGRYPGTQRGFVAAGHGGQGILTSGLTGKLVAALLDGTGNQADVEPFSPGRA